MLYVVHLKKIKSLPKGGSRAPKDPPRYALAEWASISFTLQTAIQIFVIYTLKLRVIVANQINFCKWKPFAAKILYNFGIAILLSQPN